MILELFSGLRVLPGVTNIYKDSDAQVNKRLRWRFLEEKEIYLEKCEGTLYLIIGNGGAFMGYLLGWGPIDWAPDMSHNQSQYANKKNMNNNSYGTHFKCTLNLSHSSVENSIDDIDALSFSLSISASLAQDTHAEAFTPRFQPLSLTPFFNLRYDFVLLQLCDE